MVAKYIYCKNLSQIPSFYLLISVNLGTFHSIIFFSKLNKFLFLTSNMAHSAHGTNLSSRKSYK